MPRTNVTNLQRRLVDWTQQPAQERNFRRGPTQMIEAALDDPRRRTQLSIAALLLGTWHLACGQATVLAGQSDGWDEVRIGAAFQRTALTMRSGAKPQRRGRGGGASGGGSAPPDLPVLQTAQCLCLAVALGDPGAHELCATFAGLPDASFGPDDEFPLFVRELMVLRAGDRPTLSPRLGVYEEVLLGWTGDTALLARRLATLLDHHLDNTQGSPGRPAPFDAPGVMLYPAEILALRTVRQELELPWPKVDHPLMFTNLATMLPLGAWPSDPLLARVAACA